MKLRVLLTFAVAVLAVAPVRGDDLAKLFPRELTEFKTYSGNPVFTAQGPGHWDVKIRERGWILREGDVYKLWFTGYNGERSGVKMLGFATSKDGIHWDRHPGNPIYSKHWVEDMMVTRHNGVYYMFAEGTDDQPHLLTSNDGVDWVRVRQLDVRQTNGKPIEPGPYGTPTAWFENGTWYLFYERRDAGVWLATSTDMKVWTNVLDDPVLKPGPAAEEELLIAMNQIIKHDGRYYALYHGKGKGPDWCTCIAVSSDLLNWIKYPKNPILTENKSSAVFVQADDGLRLYSMHDQVHLHLPVVEAGDNSN